MTIQVGDVVEHTTARSVRHIRVTRVLKRRGRTVFVGTIKWDSNAAWRTGHSAVGYSTAVTRINPTTRHTTFLDLLDAPFTPRSPYS